MIYRLLYTLALLFASLHTMAQERITYEYDELNRLTMVTYPNGQTVTYTYDALGNRLSKSLHGVEVPILEGDVNEDKSVTISDVTAIVSIIKGQDSGPHPLFNRTKADMNGDGEVTISDVTILVNYILGNNNP